MIVQFRVATSWLCLLSTVSGSNLAGVDDSILFKIRWKDPLSSLKQLPNEEQFDAVPMMTSEQEPFVCYIPRKLQVQGDDAEVKNYQGPTPIELLEPLFSLKVCRYKLDSYWTYQLCHGRSLRQYHEDTIASKVAIMEFYLGKSDADTRKRDNENYKKQLEESTKAESPEPTPTIRFEGVDYPYFVLNMSYGTLCDINQTPRSTQVYYICDEHSDHDIHSFEETSTCMYKVVVRTPLLCRHPKYRVEVAPENEVTCHRKTPPPANTEGKVQSEESLPIVTLKADEEVDPNQPQKLQEIERDNRNFRESSIPESEAGHYDNDFKNLVEAVERNLKIFFLQDEEEVRTEPPQHDEKDVQRVLTGDTCLTGGSGWWRYEFCYGKRVTQYHLENGEKTQEILLGKWDEANHRKWVNSNPWRKVPAKTFFVRHFYSDGDMCAVTGKPRTVEVELACKPIRGHPDAVSIFLREPKACEYKLTVESMLVCNLLTNVDEDGLPELLSPANHRPKPTEQENQEDRRKDAVEA